MFLSIENAQIESEHYKDEDEKTGVERPIVGEWKKQHLGLVSMPANK